MSFEGIILAAGFSSRAGTFKLTLELGDKPILERCLLSMYDICSKIFIIGGYKIDKISPIADKYPKVHLIYNANFKDGMLSSVKEGIKYISANKVFITPGDYPFLTHDIYNSLARSNSEITVPTYKGIKGHPVLMTKSMAKLLSESEFESPRHFICKKGYQSIEVNNSGILFDIDTIGDYGRGKLFLGTTP